MEKMRIFKKTVNFLFRKIHGYPSRPFGVLIETTNSCNFHCAICARHKLKRPLGFMDFELFKKITDNLAYAGISIARLQFFGEPLLHPRLVEMIGYAKEKGIECVNFNTNASLLGQEKARAILETSLDQIQFSLDANSEETFANVRTKGFFDSVTKNIDSFLNLKKGLNKDSPRTVLKITATKDNFLELPAIVKRWGLLLDEIQIAPMTVYEDVNLSFTDNRQFSRDICREPFQKLVVFWNGDVSVCCYDINGCLKIGNILSQDILGLWRGGPINQLRKKLTARQYDKLPCCKDCQYPNKKSLNYAAGLIRNDLCVQETLKKDFEFKINDGVLYVCRKNNGSHFR